MIQGKERKRRQDYSQRRFSIYGWADYAFSIRSE